MAYTDNLMVDLAKQVNTNLVIKLNSGSTEGSNQFTYNGSAAKTINITPASIGAAAASHGTHVSYGTAAPKANGTASAGSASTVSRSDHVHPLQTSVSGNAGSATKLATARTIDGVSFNGSANITHYGTCSTAAATAAKVVSLTGFTLTTGAKVSVKFTVTNTASSPTLNVNNTGAKPIYHMGHAISSEYLLANRIYTFIYDGTNFELVGNGNHVVAGKLPGSTLGVAATAEGSGTTASGDYSHAEGNGTTASGIASHAEGSYYATASGTASHAEGFNTTASGNYSHAEGYKSKSIGEGSHAEGYGTTASGDYSHAQGYDTKASGDYSHAGGYGTIANKYQTVIGRYNANTEAPTISSSMTGSLFIVGRGSSSANRYNAFRVTTTGSVYGNNSYNSSGADYAEYFEWKDKNTNNEDRVGLFVTLDGQYIRIANSKDDYILGIISGNPSVIGDSYFGDNWHGMYKTDIFGRLLTEIVHVDEYIDEDTKETVPEHNEERLILNPDWNPDLEYEAREDRPEWDAVGLVGKLVVIDDGTCEVNNYCKVADNGIATKSDTTSGYRVMKRLDDTHIQILFR